MSMAFDDIFGDETVEAEIAEAEINAPAPTGRNFQTLKNANVHELDRGVTTTWLAQAFVIPRKRVEQMLGRCPTLRIGSNNARIYDFRTAVQYMVKPRIDLKEYLDGLEPRDLPEQLRSEFWGARLKEQKARLNAKDLWRSEDVVAAFGELFKMIKDTAILWPDTLEESTDLTHKQRDVLDGMVRDLLSQIGDTVLNYTENSKTESQELEFEDDEDDL